MGIKRRAGESDVRGKVLIWYWGRRGGGPLTTQLLVQHLLESGFGDRLVLSLSVQSERIEAARGLGVELREVETFQAKPSLVSLVGQAARLRGEFRRLMRQVAPDAVVIPMLFGAAPLLMDLARRVETLIYVAHDARPHPGDEAGRSQRVAQTMLIRLADQTIAPSRFVAGELSRLYPGAAGRIGVEPLAGLYRAASARPRAAPVGRPLRFLAPGRLVRYKGYRRLAAALDLMPSDLAYELTIAGDGPDRAEIERLFARRPSVRLDLRWHAPEEQAALFREHDVLLCPYDEASQSGLVCDALVHAAPAIVTPVGALPEQIGNGRAGVVLVDMSPETLAAALADAVRGRFGYAAASAGCLELLKEEAASLAWTARFGGSPLRPAPPSACDLARPARDPVERREPGNPPAQARPATPAHPKPVVNSTAYWDQRFRDDWEDRDGPGQTRFFAEQAVAAMPDWFVQEIRMRRLSIFDFGCAFGDALPVLRQAFPEAVIRGGDVAPGAIATARERHPGFEFVVLDNDAPKLSANVVFCSNTIEHFADWRTRLAILVTLASDYVVTMAPFQERSLTSEHEAYFDYKTFVPVPGEPSRLDHLRIIDLRSIENTRWHGRQWLGIWSKAAERRSVRISTAFSPDDLDLRGRTSEEVGALLAAANESDTDNEAARTEIAPENHP